MDTFWSKVKKTDRCWEWTGVLNRKSGYGQFAFNKKNYPAHRFAFFLAYGKFPDNCACHKCDNRKCVRPDHLFDGTYKDNVHDAWAKGRHFDVGGLLRDRTHCPKGHLFDEANTYIATSSATGRTGRVCRACRAEMEKKRRADAAIAKGEKPFIGYGTQCRNGHPHSEANSYVHKDSSGYTLHKCRVCHAAHMREHRARLKATATA